MQGITSKVKAVAKSRPQHIARAAGFKAVAVSYGYNHGQDIRLSQPDIVIDSLADLPPMLKPRLKAADGR